MYCLKSIGTLMCLLSIFFIDPICAQNVGINTTGVAAHSSALLDVDAPDKGVLIPRVPLESTVDVGTVPSPTRALLVFNTETSADVTPGFYYWKSTHWVRVLSAENVDYWKVDGNPGTTPGADFIGTTDSVALDFRSNNDLKLRLHPTGQLEVFSTGGSVFIGQGAGLNDDLSLNNNVFIGFESGKENTSGNGNSALGYRALSFNTTAINNTAIGNQALMDNTTGSSNTAIGKGALEQNLTGAFNVATGTGSLTSNSDGSKNTSMGYLALSANDSGNGNTAIGYQTLLNAIDANFNTAVGHEALKANSVGDRNVAIGNQSLLLTDTGSGNTSVGYHAGLINGSGSFNTMLGNNSGPNTDTLNNTTSVGNGTVVTASNTVHLGNTAVTTIAGQVAFGTYSDKRFKVNVSNSVPGLHFIRELNPVTYNWDVHKLNDYLGVKEPDDEAVAKQEKILYTGFLAQDVEAAAKRSNYNFSGVVAPQNEQSLYTIRYAEFVVPLVAAVQELDGKNQNLNAKLAAQQQLIELQQKQIDQLQLQLDALMESLGEK